MQNSKCVFLYIILLVFFLSSCGGSGTTASPDPDPDPETDYRQYMRDFVQDISSYAKNIDTDFIIIPQNGHDLLTTDGEATGSLATSYISAIDGVGREDLNYGYDNDDEATPTADKTQMSAFMDIAEDNDIEVLVTDYCSTQANMDDSYQENNSNDYISFAADERDLNNIPDYPATPYNENDDNITTLAQAKNFLYLLDTDNYATVNAFSTAVAATNYDLLITDLFFQGEEELTAANVTALKAKANGGSRLVIAYMSIGEAEDYRFYWADNSTASWIKEENPDWAGNYKVEYWSSGWQDIIFGNNDSYLKKILDAGFDGVYLDIIDAFEYFEE
ncbi:endo alpha-1,4 polygalactosaminidase [bacterium]|nr:endo alpha-1,4 polygalactosaminidase [bacterium]MBU1917755.1 endo alpha-1,4 polygalactosaminidase [bacterium]